MQVAAPFHPVHDFAAAFAAGAVTAKITDFGMALRFAGNRTHASGVRQGTPFFMAPEVRARSFLPTCSRWQWHGGVRHAFARSWFAKRSLRHRQRKLFGGRHA